MEFEMISDKQIKINYFKVKKICEDINLALDKGYVVINNNKIVINPKYRFIFEEPDWNDLQNHIWFNEITLVGIGYFEPDESLREIKKYWSQWYAIPQTDIVKFI
jgi:hypothetical protein